MTIALVVAGLVVVVVAAVAWARVAAGRADRRSMQTYERSLQLLGDVSRRRDAVTHLREVTPAEPARSHVRTEPPSPPAEPAPLPAPADRVRIEPPTVSFEDDSDAYERALEAEATAPGEPPALPASAARVAPRAAGGPGRTLRFDDAEDDDGAPPRRRRRTGVGGGRPGRGIAAAGIVAVLALGTVIGLLATAGGGPRHAGGPTTTRPASGPTTTTRPVVTTTSAPTELQPTSANSSVVTFAMPAGGYTLSFSDVGGLCWVGAQQSSGGPYVWQETLSSGQSASYRASGPLIVRLGAPKFLTLRVNGELAKLPGYIQPYDLSFVGG